MKLRYTAIAAVVAAASMLAPMSARANHEGCTILGEGQGLDTERSCTYVATTPSQNVYVGTPYRWRVWVLRMDARNQPVDVTLGEGSGPQAGQPPQVRPALRETVHVTMYFGCSANVYCGTIGFLSAGLEQGHP
jgi:hypothetical protein